MAEVATKPAFDPSAPFSVAPGPVGADGALTVEGKPAFDPNAPFSLAPEGSKPAFDPSAYAARRYTLDEFKAGDEKALNKDQIFLPCSFSRE
jgi:hypothetical protein